MKKSGLLLAAAAALGVMLVGCASQKTAFTPSVSCIYIAEDGSLSSAWVEDWVEAQEGEVDTEDLKQYLEAAVIQFNQENGAEGQAENKPGADRLPAAVQSVSKNDSSVWAVLDFASAEDLIRFRESGDNADTSNTLTALSVKTAGDATEWFLSEDFTKTDGSAATLEEVKGEPDSKVACIEGGGTFRFAGQVLFLSLDAEVKDEYTVTVPDGGKAYVVFK